MEFRRVLFRSLRGSAPGCSPRWRPGDGRRIWARALPERPSSPARSRSRRAARRGDRKSVVEGKSVSVRVDLGGRRILKTKKNNTRTCIHSERKKIIRNNTSVLTDNKKEY